MSDSPIPRPTGERPTTWAADRISVLEKQVHDLKLSLMVLDATLYMLDVIARPELKEFFAGQIAVAKETYQQATGEESMIGFRRQRDG